MNQLNLSPTYTRFFLKNLKTRHVLLQGSRRSAKSWSVYKWITLLAMDKTPIEVIVCAASFPALTLAIKDFQAATSLVVQGSAVLGMHCKLPSGSVIQFKAFDIPTKAQGTACDILVCEEALNIEEQIMNVLLLGVRKQAYFIYNPTRSGSIEKYMLPDKSNFLLTTFKDNPWLTPPQIAEFEEMKERAMSPAASVLDTYNYQVYYLGQFSNAGGKVFPLVYTCSDSEFESIPSPYVNGMDFGLTPGGDPTTLVQVKIYDNCLYAKELFYSNQLHNDKDLAYKILDCGILNDEPIICDKGGMGASRAKALSTANNYDWEEPELCEGFNMIGAAKTRITEGLTEILQYDKIYVTDSSHNLRMEMDGYELKEDRTPKGPDHAIDALRYAAHYAKINGYFLS